MTAWKHILIWNQAAAGGSLGLRIILPSMLPSIRQVTTIDSLADYRAATSGWPRYSIWHTCVIAVSLRTTPPREVPRRAYRLRDECDFEGGYLALVRTEEDARWVEKVRLGSAVSPDVSFGRIQGHVALHLPLRLPKITSALAALDWLPLTRWWDEMAKDEIWNIGRWATALAGHDGPPEEAAVDWRERVSLLKEADFGVRLHHDDRFVDLRDALPVEMPTDMNTRERALARIRQVVNAAMRGEFDDGSADPDR